MHQRWKFINSIMWTTLRSKQKKNFFLKVTETYDRENKCQRNKISTAIKNMDEVTPIQFRSLYSYWQEKKCRKLLQCDIYSPLKIRITTKTKNIAYLTSNVNPLFKRKLNFHGCMWSFKPGSGIFRIRSFFVQEKQWQKHHSLFFI